MRILCAAFCALAFCGAIFAQNPPTNLRATSNVDGMVPMIWEKPLLDAVPSTIQYDGFGSGTDGAGRNDIVSVRFTPEADCSLLSTTFYAVAYAYEDIPVDVMVFPDNGSGRPNIYSPLGTIRANIIFGWQTIDLSSLGLRFVGGTDFHIGIRKLSDPDTTPHFIVHDGATPSAGRSYMFYDLMYSEAIPGNLKIRADVFYGSRDVVVENYHVYRSNTPTVSGLVHLKACADTFFTDSTVTNGTPYYYAIIAEFPRGATSAYSNMAYATPRNGTFTTYYDTIGFDDGIPNATGSYAPGNGFGTLMYSNSRGKVFKLLYYFNTTGAFSPQLWTADASGRPSGLLWDSDAWPEITATGWRGVTVPASRTIYYNGGKFVAACIFGDRSTGLGVDVPGEGYSFDYTSGTPTGTWASVVDSTYMIRAVLEYKPNTVQIELVRNTLNAGWNLVSLPFTNTDSRVRAIFPTAFAGEAYTLKFLPEIGTVGWSIDTTITPINAYWVKTTRETTYTLTGEIPYTSQDVFVRPGLNLIGVPAKMEGFAVSELITYPSDLLGITPYVYEYDPARDAMVPVTRLYPGKGYAVYVLHGPGYIRFQ